MHEPRLDARTSSARSSRSACGSSTCGCSSARTPTSTTAARPRRSRSAPAASSGCTRATSTSPRGRTTPTRALPRRIEVARQSGVPGGAAAALGGAPARGTGTGIARAAGARPRPAVAGVEVETDLGAWQVHRDARPRAVARLPAPARAPAADLRRPPARPHLALLRLRLDARPGRRVPRLARRASTALDVRLALSGHGAPVHRRARPHRRQPRARRASGSTRCRAALAARGEATAFELLPGVYGDRLTPGDARLAADQDCSATSTTSSAGGRACARAGGEPERWSAPPRLRRDADRRADRAAAPSRPSRSSSSRRKTDEGERNLGRALAELSRAATRRSCRSPTARAAADRARKTIDIVSPPQARLRPGGDGALHLRRRDGRRSCARCSTRCATRGIENVLALRGDPPQGETEWTATEGGLSYSRELIELIRDEYDFAIGAACFPEVHIHATDAESDLRYLKEKVDAGARFLITQLFFDNQALLRLRRPRARRSASTSRSSRASCRSRTSSQIKRVTEMCGATIPDGLLRELELRGDEPERGRRPRRRLRDAAVRRPARQRRARDPLLHAQPLAGDARDPQRAAAHGAVARRRAAGADAVV